MHIFEPCVCLVPDQKRASDSLELELGTVGVLETKPGSLQ